MDRRNFLKALALTGAAFSIKETGAMTLMSQHFNAAPNNAKGAYDLVAVLGGEPEAMFRKAITELGGIGQFVKKGQKVVVKPKTGQKE
jgi:hypothetical protein